MDEVRAMNRRSFLAMAGSAVFVSGEAPIAPSIIVVLRRNALSAGSATDYAPAILEHISRKRGGR